MDTTLSGPRPICAIALICASTFLASCASQPVATAPGEIRVVYTNHFSDGSLLKAVPQEVSIVRREDTVNLVGVQVALNIAMLALGGGIGVQGFSKDELKGSAIEYAGPRDNLKNPVVDAFVPALAKKIGAAVRQDPELNGRTFNRYISVAGGSASLVYEALADGEEERFRLKTHLQVYKKKESAGMFSFSPLVIVDCSDASDPAVPLGQWAEADFQPVRTQLDDMLSACEAKVMAELPALLKD